jgi:hypothetical protein
MPTKEKARLSGEPIPNAILGKDGPEYALPQPKTQAPQRKPQFIILLEPEKYVVDPVRALRGALKRLLRSYGLKAISVEEKKPANNGGVS